MNIHEAINYIDETFKKLNIDIIYSLNPGVDVPINYLNFQLPKALIAFHQWHDGTNIDSEILISDFFPYYIYDSYYYSLDVYNRLSKYWLYATNWFPVFSFSANSRFLIIHDVNDDNCPISSWDLEVGEPILQYESLSAMLVSISECYKQGAFCKSGINDYEINDEAVAEINNYYNPTVGYWKDLLDYYN